MNEAERYRDLAERVMGRSPEGTEVSLLLEALPPEADGRIRLPDGARLIGSVVRRPLGDLGSITAYVGSPLDAKAFDKAVRALYEADGYHPAPPQPGYMGGFRSAGTGSAFGNALCRGEDGPWVHCSSRATATGSESFIAWNAPSAGMGPCSPRAHGMPFPDVLAPLEAPDGVQLLPGGGYGGGGGSWTTSAGAYTTLSARELIDTFAAQLEAAGAAKLGSGGDDMVAWSEWKLAKDPWEALLLAFGRDERKELQLRVERDDYRKREDAMRRGMSARIYGF
ncbi:MAG TPA: hypothetical protein VGA38_01760 [Candidatus Limnocylindria bacterium]